MSDVKPDVVTTEESVTTSDVTTTQAVLHDEPLGFWGRHRLSLLLAIAIAIALVLTSVSMFLYTVSGTAQLDLSRPGLRTVSDKVEPDDISTEYDTSGRVDKAVIEDFLKQYDERASKAKAVDAFNGDPLNPEVLEFGSPSSDSL